MVLELVEVVFEGYRSAETDGHIASLRALPDGPIDLTLPAQVFPPRSRAVRATEIAREIRALQSDCIAFAAAGVLGREFEAIDRILNSALLIRVAETVVPIAPRQRTSKHISEGAADLLDELRPHVSRARALAGVHWKFGSGVF